MIAVARTADLVVMMMDASKGQVHKRLLKNELESVGIRLNKGRPGIYFKEKKTGGMAYTTQCKQTHGVDEKLCKDILHQYSM